MPKKGKNKRPSKKARIPFLDLLPAEVWLKVLSFLGVADKCRIARVCKDSNQLIKTPSLWERIDLIQPGVHLNKKTWAYMRQYFSSSLTALHIGFSTGQPHKTITNDAIQAISRRCENLRNLTLARLDLSKLQSDNLPRSLKALQIIECKMKDVWLGEAVIAENIDGLECLEIRHGSHVEFYNEMITFSKLRKLSLSKPPIGDTKEGPLDYFDFLVFMPTKVIDWQDYCKELTTLQFSNVFMWSQCLEYIGERLTCLRHLTFENCWVQRSTLQDWLNLKKIVNLETLCIVKCYYMDKELEEKLVEEFSGVCKCELVSR